jgi:hypothetical protein
MKHVAPVTRPRRAQTDDIFNEVFLFRIVVAVLALFKQDSPF